MEKYGLFDEGALGDMRRLLLKLDNSPKAKVRMTVRVRLILRIEG